MSTFHPMVPQPLNTPSKPQVQGAGSGRSQKDRRYMDTFRDNHKHPTRFGGLFAGGRPWCGPREIAANRETVPVPPDGFVIGDLMMGEYVQDDGGNCDRGATLNSTWQAPWRPLAKYFRFNYNRKLITFDYAKMRLDEENGLRDYYKAAGELGFQLNIRVDEDVLPHPQIVSKLGRPSRMMIIAEAAQAGDPWLLGFIDEPNPTLADILGIHPVRGFARYTPPAEPEVPQETAVQAILQAPPNTDLLQMLATMAETMKTLGAQVADLTAERDKKATQSQRIKAGMAKAKTSKPAQEVA